VHDHFGVVDQFLGDGMKVLFNVPVRRVTHQEDAMKAALALQRRCRGASFGVGIGLETGMALAGHIGLDTVADFTCVGEAVNTAARLQALAGPGEIVIGPTLWRKAADLLESDGLVARPETVDLKGIGPVEIHRVAAYAPRG
jgi:class 3 adenylate cyclase